MADLRTKIFVSSIALVMVLLAFAGLPAVKASSSNGPSGEFIFGTPISTSVADLNPLTATNSLATILTGQMYADSLGFQWTNGNVTPWLASSWNVVFNSNGTENITFNLNPNADWVNGTSVVGPITSKDVKFTFDALIANSSLDTYGIGPSISAIYTPNNETVSILFKDQSTLWFDYVATQTIIPSAWAVYDNGNISHVGSYLNMGPYGKEITAGPFILKNITSTGGTLVANTHFWMGVPHVETIYVEKFSSTADADLALEDGTIGGSFPSLSDFKSLSTYPSITNVKQVEPWTFYLWLNDSISPYNNVHFRRGLAYAINKTQIMIKAEDGLGSWGQGNFSFGGLPTVLKSDWAPNLKYYEYNVSMAQMEFEKAGYHLNSAGYFVNNTTDKQLSLNVIEPPVSDWEAAGNFIMQDLNAAGISTTLSSVPFSTWGADVFGSKFTNLTYFGYVPPFANPYLQLQMPYDYNGAWNFEHYSNPTLNNYFNTTITEPQANLVSSLYPVQQLIDSQVPLIPIGNANNYYSYNHNVIQGFIPNLTMDNPLNFMTIYSVQKTTSNPYTLYYEIGGIIAVIAVVGGVAGYYVSRGKKKEVK